MTRINFRDSRIFKCQIPDIVVKFSCYHVTKVLSWLEALLKRYQDVLLLPIQVHYHWRHRYDQLTYLLYLTGPTNGPFKTR